MKKRLIEALKKNGASDAGICRMRKFHELSPALEEERITPPSWARSAVVFIVSYKSDISGNISSYAYGKDYHKVLPKIANSALEILHNGGFQGEVFADTGNLCDRHLAYLSGLGFSGKNHCLISPKFGSFVFIGYILTDCILEDDTPLKENCKNCGKCISSCPTGALLSGDFSKCLSDITQRRGELSEKEMELIKKSGCIWGCDICQRVCPHNENAPNTQIPEFSENLITELSVPRDISNREFLKEYGNRAFSWRGKNVILRNQKLIN